MCPFAYFPGKGKVSLRWKYARVSLHLIYRNITPRLHQNGQLSNQPRKVSANSVDTLIPLSTG